MTRCYVWQGKGGDNLNYAFALCVPVGSTVGWTTGTAYPSGNYKLPAVNGSLADGASDFYITPENIAQPNNQTAYNAAISGRGVRGNCISCINTYDCINGSCVISSTYSTPGVFSSLEACQAQCSANGNCGDGKVCADINYCPPGKVCIENGEYSEIQGLMNRLSSELS